MALIATRAQRKRSESVRKCLLLSTLARISAQFRRRWMTRTMRDLKNCKNRAGARTQTSARTRPVKHIVTFCRRNDRNSGRNRLVTLCQFVSMFAKARCAHRNRQRAIELHREPQGRAGGKGDKKTLSQSKSHSGNRVALHVELSSPTVCTTSLETLSKGKPSHQFRSLDTRARHPYIVEKCFCFP